MLHLPFISPVYLSDFLPVFGGDFRQNLIWRVVRVVEGAALENEPPQWNPRNRKPLIFLGFPRSSDASFPLYLSCLSLRFPGGFWRRFQAKPYMESCPSGRRCSTRNAVKSNLPRVRIPNSPPAKPYRSRSARLFSLFLER